MGVIKLYENLDSEDINDVPLKTVKDFLSFFGLSTKDLEKLVEFSDDLKKDKQFVFKHKKQYLSLTEREREVFKLVVEGKTSKEIADKLFIETVTVSTHRKHIRKKLNLNSIYDWYKFAKVFDIIKL